MTSADEELHAAFGARLAGLRLGLLGPSDEQAVRTHLASCVRCREALADADAAFAAAGAGHVPPSVLARWPAIADRMGPLERSLTVHHLGRCEDCRADLATAEAARAAGTVVALPGARAQTWTRAWAVGATAAAACLALLLWRAGTPVAPRTASAPAGTSAISVQVGTRAVALHDVVRGAGSTPAVLDLGPREIVALSFDPPDVPDDTPVRIELARSDGRLLAMSMRTQHELYPDRRVLLGSEASPLRPGDYALRVIARPPGAAADTQSYAFSVRRAR